MTKKKAEIKPYVVLRFRPPDPRYASTAMRMRSQIVYRLLLDGKEVAINQSKRNAKKFATEHGIEMPSTDHLL